MKITIFEVCRSPEIKKITEPVVLSQFFIEKGVTSEVCSNDQIWPNPVILSQAFIEDHLRQSNPDVVHLAMHGNNNSFILTGSTRYKEFKDNVRVAFPNPYR